MAIKITKRSVDSLRSQARPYIAFDSELKGFGVRVFPSGAKVYIVEYRPGAGGRGVGKRRVKLGNAQAAIKARGDDAPAHRRPREAEMTAERARKAASSLLAKVRLGGDPAADRHAERAMMTVADLIDEYSTAVEAKRKSSTAAGYKQLLNGTLRPEFGTRKVDALNRASLAKLHLKMKDTPYSANRLLAVVSAMYAFAAERHIVPEGFNPARGVERFSEKNREKFLTGEELDHLGSALREAETTGLPWNVDSGRPKAKHTPKEASRFTKLAPHAIAAVRLLLFTGCRLREILHLRWSDVDLERGFLFLPDSKTGKKTIVLNAPALAVLASLKRIGGYVIAGDNAGTKDEKPRADLKRPWAAISARAGLDSVRIHDLRHTFASFGASSGLGLPVIGKLLGHKQSATTARYSHIDIDPARRAAQHIGQSIADALGYKVEQADESAEVVPFRRAST
jgi:integrase